MRIGSSVSRWQNCLRHDQRADNAGTRHCGRNNQDMAGRRAASSVVLRVSLGWFLLTRRIPLMSVLNPRRVFRTPRPTFPFALLLGVGSALGTPISGGWPYGSRHAWGNRRTPARVRAAAIFGIRYRGRGGSAWPSGCGACSRAYAGAGQFRFCIWSRRIPRQVPAL